MKLITLMKLIDPRTTYILKNPVAFTLQVLKAFQANQGLLLAGAVAYYALIFNKSQNKFVLRRSIAAPALHPSTSWFQLAG